MGKVFAPANHDWTKHQDEQWRGTCPLCSSDNGQVLIVAPKDLSWCCFKCEEGSGPPAYEHQRQGGFGLPTGEDFEDAVRELADTAGVEVPDTDEEDTGNGEDSRRERPCGWCSARSEHRTRAPVRPRRTFLSRCGRRTPDGWKRLKRPSETT